MDDIIHLLPDSVANQIAAGEVVQRPSSIVKEMVENSIDAGATDIQVLVTDGGKTCVQIIDNGKGMSETDARLSFERHATSKIQKASDLFNLQTMGFRGEALASIAAVSQVELKTRRPEDELGTLVQLSGAKIERQEPIACPVGSNFAVKNLFFNIPARRKFLKTNQTELSNIISDFQRIVLVYPDISFTLYNNGTEVFKLPVASLRQRIIDVFGKKINSELLPVDAETSLVRISGYIGKPESARKKGSHQYFFVNGRYMRHPYFHSAVMHAYENLIPAGEHVSYFLYLSVDASTIDVNVHPTKTEIKFDNEQPIWQVLSAVAKEALGKYSNVPTIDFDVEDRPEIPAMGSGDGSTPQLPRPIQASYNPFTAKSKTYERKPTDWQALYRGMETFEKKAGNKSSGIGSLVSPEEEYLLDGFVHRDKSDVSADPLTSVEKVPEQQSSLWNHLGGHDDDFSQEIVADVSHLPHFQYKGRFIVIPLSSGLMFVDQHRAHVRILYEDYMHKISEKTHMSQGMLFPEIVQFTKAEELAVEQIQEELEYIGFELSNLGGGSYSINGVPSGIEGLNPQKLLHNLVYVAIEQGTSVRGEVEKSIALAMAQSAAIVYGQVLADEEITILLTQLFQLSSPLRTPDGKIVFSILPHHEIEKMF